MILFIGSKDIYDFILSVTPDITYDIGVESADKLIVCDASDKSFAAVRAASLINIPILGILDGIDAVSNAHNILIEPIENCSEGKQEHAIVDCENPLFKGLETVIKVCRGKPYSVVENALPCDMDCAARAETGEILAFYSKTSSVYGVNFHLTSNLTPRGRDIIKNFVDL